MSSPYVPSPVQPADQHDTIVLGDTRAPGSAPADWQAGGWQQAGWRAAMAQGAPTAWSQVPPFVSPSPQPTVLVMRNNAAVVGATLGSVSLFLSLLPVIGIVAWLLAPIALLTSAVGLVVGVVRTVGRVGAIWGLVTSGMALVVCFAWLALVLAL